MSETSMLPLLYFSTFCCAEGI